METSQAGNLPENAARTHHPLHAVLARRHTEKVICMAKESPE